MAVWAAGLTGALAFSQLPAYTDDYTQRLAGAVDALTQVVADFDASARAEGMTRTAALATMTGNAFLERRQADLSRAFLREESLMAHLDDMRRAGPATRSYILLTRGDWQIMQAAWRDFRPAIPLTASSALMAGLGFAAGSLGIAAAGAMTRRRLQAA